MSKCGGHWEWSLPGSLSFSVVLLRPTPSQWNGSAILRGHASHERYSLQCWRARNKSPQAYPARSGDWTQGRRVTGTHATTCIIATLLYNTMWAFSFTSLFPCLDIIIYLVCCCILSVKSYNINPSGNFFHYVKSATINKWFWTIISLPFTCLYYKTLWKAIVLSLWGCWKYRPVQESLLLNYLLN